MVQTGAINSLRYLASRGRSPPSPIFAYMQCYVLSLCMQRDKRKGHKKKGTPTGSGRYQALARGGGGEEERAKNSTGIKHKSLRSNTYTPKERKKTRFVETSNAWKGKGMGKTGLALPSWILTLSLFPVGSPKSFFVSDNCAGWQKSKKPSKQAKQEAAGFNPAHTYPTQRITVQHVTLPLGTHTPSLFLSSSLLQCIFSGIPLSKMPVSVFDEVHLSESPPVRRLSIHPVNNKKKEAYTKETLLHAPLFTKLLIDSASGRARLLSNLA
ncbi:hypothetical protein GGI42DRAFT_91720 [Trichoderma sp. SZMC 28013]